MREVRESRGKTIRQQLIHDIQEPRHPYLWGIYIFKRGARYTSLSALVALVVLVGIETLKGLT